MGEHVPVEERPATRGEPFTVASVFTPKATAIAGFAFAVLSMTGQGIWTQVLQALWGQGFPASLVGYVLVSWAGSTLLVALVALLLARRTLRDGAAAAGWEGHLARAAVIVASVGALLSLVAILGGLARSV